MCVCVCVPIGCNGAAYYGKGELSKVLCRQVNGNTMACSSRGGDGWVDEALSESSFSTTLCPTNSSLSN